MERDVFFGHTGLTGLQVHNVQPARFIYLQPVNLTAKPGIPPAVFHGDRQIDTEVDFRGHQRAAILPHRHDIAGKFTHHAFRTLEIDPSLPVVFHAESRPSAQEFLQILASCRVWQFLRDGVHKGTE